MVKLTHPREPQIPTFQASHHVHNIVSPWLCVTTAMSF